MMEENKLPLKGKNWSMILVVFVLIAVFSVGYFVGSFNKAIAANITANFPITTPIIISDSKEISIPDLHILYGEMISTAYDVIEKSPHSVNEMENFLGCDDEMEPLFECLFEDYSYEGELRAFPRPIAGNHVVDSFFGFKAFNEKSGDLAIIFRGTVFGPDVGNDIRFLPEKWPASKGSKMPINIHRGFLEIYQKTNGDRSVKSLKEYLHSYIKSLILEGKKTIKTISLSGHSLGASIATIATLGIAEQIEEIYKCSCSMTEKPKIRLISFASPKVGGKNLWKRLDELNVAYDHYFNAGDVVPMAPPFYWHHPNPKTQHKMKPSDKELREKGFHFFRVNVSLHYIRY